MGHCRGHYLLWSLSGWPRTRPLTKRAFTWHAVSVGCRGILEPWPSARSVNDAIILNPACQPEFRLSRELFHSHRLGVAAQIDYIIGILRAVCRHNNIAFDSLAGSERLIQQAIEAIPADISGFRTQGVSVTVAGQVQGPMECRPSTPASFDSGMPPCLVGLYGVGQWIAG